MVFRVYVDVKLPAGPQFVLALCEDPEVVGVLRSHDDGGAIGLHGCVLNGMLVLRLALQSAALDAVQKKTHQK